MSRQLPACGSDLTLIQILSSLTTQADAAALVEHLARISRPKDGGSKVLVLFARLAQAPWNPGDIVVELRAEGPETLVDVRRAEPDAGPVFPQARFHAPLSEFVSAAKRHHELLQPLVLVECDRAHAALSTTPAASLVERHGEQATEAGADSAAVDSSRSALSGRFRTIGYEEAPPSSPRPRPPSGRPTP